MIYAFLIAALIVRPSYPTFLFVASATLFQLVLGDADGSVYFLLAAFCDYMVAGLLYRFGQSRKSLDMMLISIVSIILNLTGWILWYFYLPPDVYVGLFGVLYTVAIITILRKDGEDVGGTEIHIDYASHHSNADSGR